MADKEKDANKAKPDAAAKPKRGGKLGLFTTLTVFVFASPFIMPTLLLLFLGMLPTMVAMITDSDRQKSSAIAIGSLNFAGITPFIIDLWMKGQTMANVFRILTEPSSWLVMLGAAGVGQLVVFAIPPVLASFTTVRYEARLKVLKENMESLKSTWGPEVATTKPVNKIGQKE